MKVFISYSGKLSLKVAEAFNKWLPLVIQSVDTFFSPEMEKGKKWLTEIPSALEECDFGIICLTSNNLDEPWILFESGALAKKLTKSNVATFLVNVDTADVEFPMAMFQDTKFKKDDVFKLFKSLNNNIPKGKLKPDVLKTAFEKYWPDLENEIKEALVSKDIKKAEKRKRPNNELLAEILQIVRGMQSDVSKSKSVSLSDLTRKELVTGTDLFVEGFKFPKKGSFLEALESFQKQQMSNALKELLNQKEEKSEGSKNVINKDADKDSSKNIINK